MSCVGSTIGFMVRFVVRPVRKSRYFQAFCPDFRRLDKSTKSDGNSFLIKMSAIEK